MREIHTCYVFQDKPCWARATPQWGNKKKFISIHINKRKKKKLLRQQYQIWRSHKDINEKKKKGNISFLFLFEKNKKSQQFLNHLEITQKKIIKIKSKEKNRQQFLNYLKIKPKEKRAIILGPTGLEHSQKFQINKL